MEDYQDRVILEKTVLDEKTTKLGQFIRQASFLDLPEIQQNLLRQQHVVMTEYAAILQKRVNLF